MDRRTIWAILLMMVIAIAPALFLERPAPNATADGAPGPRGRTAAPPAEAGPPPAGEPFSDTVSSPRPAAPPPPGAAAVAGAVAGAADTVWVSSPLYRYGVDTRGARLVVAALTEYRSMAPADSGRVAQILPPDSELLGLTLVQGSDTVALDQWSFTPSA